MASTFRVATLETAFTADTSGIDAAVKAVRGETDKMDGQVTEAEIVADATDALRQIDDMRDELEEVSKSDTEAVITADVDDAERAIEDVSDELDDLRDEDVSVDVDVDADKARDGLRRAEEGLGDFRDESNQIAKESATSFTGEWEDVTDVFRDLAANAFAGFGPAGVAAGVAVAAGIGIAISAAQDLAEANTEAKESAADMATGIADGSRDAREEFREWATEVREDNAWTFWKDEAQAEITAVSDSFNELGETGAQAFAAIADADVGEMNRTLSDMNAELEVLYDKNLAAVSERAGGAMGGLRDVTHETESLTDAEKVRLEALEEAAGVLEEQIQRNEDAEEIARALLMVEEDLTEEQAEQELAIRDNNAAIAEQNDLRQTGIESTLDLADGLADMTDKEKEWKASLDDSTQAGRDNIREVLDLTDNIEALGESVLEQTGSQAQANQAMREARGDLLDTADAAGYNRGEIEDLIGTVLDIPDEANTDVDMDTSSARRKGESLTDYINRLSADVEVDADTSAARAAINALSYGSVTVDVATRAGGPVSFHYADGGISDAPASAMIAPAGADLVHWAEPETGGEAYIPLAASKRGRSMDILADVADRFGATLTSRADGGVDGVRSPSPGVVQYITNNYPQAEPTSVTTNRSLQYAAAIGV